jgi:hypothetical protein
MGVSERILRQRRMVELGLGDVGHQRDLIFAINARVSRMRRSASACTSRSIMAQLSTREAVRR